MTWAGNVNPKGNHSEKAPRKFFKWAIVLIGLVLLFFPGILFKPVFDRQIVKALQKLYPGSIVSLGDSRYNLWRNSFSSNQVYYLQKDSAVVITCSGLSVKGIKWAMVLLRGRLTDRDMVNASLNVHRIRVDFNSVRQRFFSCQNLKISVRDSEIRSDSVELGTRISDEQYFAAGKYRKTRINLLIPSLFIRARLSADQWKAKEFFAGEISIDGALFELLVNKDKEFEPGKPVTLMPNELLRLSSVKLRIDTFSVINSQVAYSERFSAGWKPATVTFSDLTLRGKNISNLVPSDTSLLELNASILDNAPVFLRLRYPLGLAKFNLKLDAKLGNFSLSRLNPFIENAEHIRIKSGYHYHTSIQAQFSGNKAVGQVKSSYENINVALIDSVSKQEKGELRPLASYIANTFKIKNTNLPTISGAEKRGEIDYSQQEKDTFVKFIWNSIKFGIGDIVGFGKKQK